MNAAEHIQDGNYVTVTKLYVCVCVCVCVCETGCVWVSLNICFIGYFSCIILNG